MIRPMSNVRSYARTLMVTVLLAGWPAMAGAEAVGDAGLALHPDAYWYNNENHASTSVQPTAAPVVEAAQETWDTALALHPDAYWYNNENHTPSAPEASTPSVELASGPR